MNAQLLRNLLLILCALSVSITAATAEVINSTYIGPDGGNWGDPANWSPAIVPDNNGTQTFDVSLGIEGVNLDIDATVNSFALTGDFASLNSSDHNFTSGSTNVDGGSQLFYFSAENENVLADFGNFVQFSGTTLHKGGFQIDTSYSTIPGITSTAQFNGADIRTSNGIIGLFGAGARLVDENGQNALANFYHNRRAGIFDIEQGQIFTSAGPLINEGVLYMATSFDQNEGPELLTVNGDYTTIGYSLDFNTQGINDLLAAGPLYDAEMLIKGRLTNYDATTQTLQKCNWLWEAANGASATTKVVGGNRPLDIVTSQAALILFGPNTGFRDKDGNSALRNLSTSARLLIGDRDFTTKRSFTSTSRLSIFGDTAFTVNGDLTIASGYFQVSVLTGYARQQDPDFPIDPKYLNSHVAIKRNFYLASPAILRPHVLDTTTNATITVMGRAFLSGLLEVSLEEDANPSASDSFTMLTAQRIVGQFANVPSGERLTVYSSFDFATGENTGDPIGTFLVTYGLKTLVLSDFQPISGAPSSRPAVRSWGDQ